MITISRLADEEIIPLAQDREEFIKKTKKRLIVMLTLGLALIGAFSVFAMDHHMHGDTWEHMHHGMWSQTGDHMSDHQTNCWTDLDQKWKHHDNDDHQE
jgi:hypothetical protein